MLDKEKTWKEVKELFGRFFLFWPERFFLAKRGVGERNPDDSDG